MLYKLHFLNPQSRLLGMMEYDSINFLNYNGASLKESIVASCEVNKKSIIYLFLLSCLTSVLNDNYFGFHLGIILI